jgi:hypothetical protein
MGNTKATRLFEQLNPGLSKWIIIHDTDSSDIISVPIGSGDGVVVQSANGAKTVVVIKEAGHDGTWLAHTRKDAAFTINNAGSVPNDPSVAGAIIRGILAFLADNNPGSSRVLEILPNTEMFGINTGQIGFNWNVTP